MFDFYEGFVITTKTFKLDGAGIDAFSETLDEILAGYSMELQNRLRVRLSMEEACLRLRDRFGEKESFRFQSGKWFGQPFLEIEKVGGMFNPLSKTEKSMKVWSGSLLTTAGLSPQYSYNNGTNILRLSLPVKRMNPILKILLFVAAGLLLGMLAPVVLQESEISVLCTVFFDPMEVIWIRILTVISGPVIFLMIITTILSTGAIAEQGGDTRIAVARYLFFSILAALITVVFAQLVFRPDLHGQRLDRDAVTGFLELITHFIPEDAFKAFSTADAPQLLVMAFVLGNALVVIGTPVSGLTSIVRQMGMVAQLLAEWIGRLVPYFTALLICMEILEGHTALLKGLWIILIAAFFISGVMIFGMQLYTGYAKHVSPGLLFRKLRKPFETAIRAGSVEASFGLTEESCITDLGIESHFAKVSLPHGIVLYMPINLAGILCFLTYAASEYDVNISQLWFILAMVLSVMLFIATPPLPGANLLAYMALFIELGIPNDALIDAMIFDIIFSTFAAAGNQAMLQMELILQSDSLGLLDKEILRRKMVDRKGETDK